jgi:hypothetical protein
LADVGGSGKERKIRYAGFFIDFEPNFIHPQAMKFTLIYRRWKRDVLSLQVPNLGP